MSIRRSLFLFTFLSILFLVILYIYLLPDVDSRRYFTEKTSVNHLRDGRELIDSFLKSYHHRKYSIENTHVILDHGSSNPNGYSNERRSNMINDDSRDDVVFGHVHNKDPETEWREFSLKEDTLEYQDPIKLGMINTVEELKLKKDGYKKYAFNVLVSNRLSLSRKIPDTRHPLCKNITYPPVSVLPSASVLICFYNEAFSVLLRTIYSVINRSNPMLLKEIILIDDFSDNDVPNKLTSYIAKNLPNKVTLIRTPERAGLIRARNYGAHHATGSVLVFLDSHIEVNQNWLIPLLSRISEHSNHVVCPMIDIINSDTFEYTASPFVKGGFNWALHFKWDSVPESLLRQKVDFTKPIESPTMAGGLYAIERKYFFELGKYDDGMDIWGGENVEMSLRIWMCGGKLEILPCSRVGHIFRNSRPYGSPTGEDTMAKNSLRVANVWLDEYKKYFYDSRPDLEGHEYGDVSDRIKLRKRLQCKSFDWYMKNVYTDATMPRTDDEKSRLKERLDKIRKLKPHYYRRRTPRMVNKYQIQLPPNLCVEPKNGKAIKGASVVLAKCMAAKRQRWSETEKHELRISETLCLDTDKTNSFAVLAKCHEQGGKQDWRHSTNRHTLIQNLGAGLCLGLRKPRVGEPILMTMCHKSNAQKWTLISSLA